MDSSSDPLLPLIRTTTNSSTANGNSSTNSLPIPRWRLLSHLSLPSVVNSPTAVVPSLLSPLPEHDELPDLPLPSPSSSSFKDRLIFGPTDAFFSPPASPLTTPSPLGKNLFRNADFEIPDETSTDLNQPVPPPIAAARAAAVRPEPPPYLKKYNLHRCRTAPAMSVMPAHDRHTDQHASSSYGPPRKGSLVRQSVVFLLAYLALGVAIFMLSPSSSFTSAAGPTHPVVDALYFCIVTMCTIGYGDITPATPLSKLFSIAFVLIGFGFIDILLSAMVSYVLDMQEGLLLAAVKARATPRGRASYVFDLKKGRMRIRMKVSLALGVLVGSIGVGTIALHVLEHLGWLDAVYLSVMSVTTVGYGDRAFKTLLGRLFASVWLLVSTLAVARAFLFLAEARIDKRHRMMAKWILSRDLTISEFLAADIDNNGFVTKSEYVVYKLKEMGKVLEKDILLICDQFDRLDTGKCGKIHLTDLIEGYDQQT